LSRYQVFVLIIFEIVQSLLGS